MDDKWKINKFRFLDKIDYMDYSFCTTDPKSLNFNKKYKISYIPNPVDESLDDMRVHENTNPQYDLFLQCHMEFIEVYLKKVNLTIVKI